MDILTILLITNYFLFSVLAGAIVYVKNQKGAGIYFFTSLIFTPIVGLIIALMKPDNDNWKSNSKSKLFSL